MTNKNIPGEDKAWELVAALKPEKVCRTASVAYDPAATSYRIRSFGMDFVVSINNRTITSTAPGSEVLLTRMTYFFKLSVLWYLVSAKDIACTNDPVKLEHLKGGDIFTRGSHALPLDAVAKKYGKDKNAFIEKGKLLGADIITGGDACLRLSPLPRIPVILTLWLEDEEFPARVDLFFDSTCGLHLPIDIVWSVAMMGLLAML